MSEDKNSIWIPFHGAQLWGEMKKEMEPIAIMRMAYFFWNNFSYNGWDEHLAEQVLLAEKEEKELVHIKKRGRYGQ